MAGTPEGSGVSGHAFRNQRACVSNDFLSDQHSLAWREGAKANQVGAAAALPLLCNGESVGVLLVSRREAHSIARSGGTGDAAAIGREAGEALRGKAGANFFEGWA